MLFATGLFLIHTSTFGLLTQTMTGFSLGGNIVGDRGLWVTHPDLELARSDAGVSYANGMFTPGMCRHADGMGGTERT